MEAPSTSSDAEQALLFWLESEPVGVVEDDLAMLRTRVRDVFGDAGFDRNPALLCALAERIGDIGARLRPLLLARPLPVEVSLFEANEQLCALALNVASGIASMVDTARRRRGGGAGAAEQFCKFAIGLVTEIFALAGLAAAPPPAGTWRLVHDLAARYEIASLAAEDPLRCAYVRLLAVAVAQPEGLTGREVAWLYDFLDVRVLGAAVLVSGGGDTSASAWWIDLGADLGPQAVARRTALSVAMLGGEVLSFNPRPMAQKLGDCIEWVTARMTAAELAGMQVEGDLLEAEEDLFPPGLSPLEIVALLRRLRNHWMAAPVRGQPRRQNQYVVQVGIGLQVLWELGGGGVPEAGLLQEWMVLNESPGGLAIMSVAGVRGDIEAGCALALRRDPEQVWSVCIVRWVRSDSPGQVEVGLQLIAQSFHSVRVGFRGRTVQQLSPALALPIMEPLRRHPAMLAVAGTYASRRFVFVRETQTVYVAQARALGLDMQTPSIELFQYEIDPYPI